MKNAKWLRKYIEQENALAQLQQLKSRPAKLGLHQNVVQKLKVAGVITIHKRVRDGYVWKRGNYYDRVMTETIK